MPLISEDKWLLKQRERVIRDWAFCIGNDTKTFEKLEAKYGSIPFLKIACDPIVTPDGFEEWYFDNCISSRKPDGKPHEHNDLWYTINHVPKDYNYSVSFFTKKSIDCQERWPDLFKQLEDAMPFKELIHFDLWSSQRDVFLHRDHSYFLDLPLDFRVILYDENPEPTLVSYEIEPSTEQMESKYDDIYHQLNGEFFPHGKIKNEFWLSNETGHVYAWNNYTTKHESKKQKNHRKIIFRPGWTNVIDWDKYEYLIDKTLGIQ